MLNPKTILSALFAMMLFLQGCNPVKKALRNQAALDEAVDERLKKFPPRIDTVPVFKKGKDNYIPYPVPVLDTTRLNAVKDSLQAALKVRFKDINDSTQADCERQIDEAFEVGYQQAVWLFSQQKAPAPDTIINTIRNTDVEQALRKENNNLKGQILQMEKQQTKSNLWLWLFIASVAGNAILLFAFIKAKMSKPFF